MERPELFKRSTLSLALLGAIASPVFAQEEVSNLETDTLTVFGKAYRNTATKTALEPEETPQGITVIDNEQLEQRSVKSLNQALRYAPGVVTETKGSSVTMYDTFTIRGFGVDQSYYDGLVLQSLKGWNLQPQIDPIAMQQVEVFKGPTSVLYGSMPPGGMVNMIAKSPQLDPSTTVGVATGSRNLMEASIDTTGQIGDSDFSYRFIGLARKQDSQVDNAKEERYVIAPSIDWQATDRTLVNFNLYYQNDPSMGINSSLPASGMFIDNPNGSTSPSTSAGDKNWSKFEREVLMLGYKINHDFGNGWSLLQNARFTDATLYQENTYHTADQFDQGTGNLDRYIYSTDESSKGFVIDNQLSAQIHAANIEHNLLFGLDYQKLDGDSRYLSFGTTSQFGDFNIFNPNNDMIDRSQLEKDADYLDKVSVEQLGIYFQDQMRIDRLVLIAGGRYDWYRSTSDYTGEYEYDGDWYDYALYEEAKQEKFSYRLGALYEFDNGISPFLSYATSFEPVAGLDRNGSAYKPELGQQVEGGVKYVSADMSKQATASLFHIVKSDALMADPEDPWGPQLQVGELTSQGLELEGRWFMTESIDLNASYTYIDIEITEDSGNDLKGTTPIYVPEHAANLWANYYVYGGPLAGTRLSGGARYVGEMQMDATNTQGKVPSYTVVDLSLGYDLGYLSDSLSGATANLIVNNLFDEEYYTCYDQANCWYGAEQSFELNMNYNF
ncbi:TonB-dependent siderophore receptor [Vibrio sp. WXL103]|uniref:TonB-dependent siderophore receptor n=1 Tax=Vibrio sp. WXL103 TaxID=3450710 RepID=UPI003EC6D276